jgi:sec-independent protein translocase protein TatA
MTPIFGFLQLNAWEILILLGLGVLLFGRKLPEVGRYLGKGIVEFKKGMKGLEDDVDAGTNTAPRTDAIQMQQQPPPAPPQRVQTGVPKFEDNPNNITTPPKA